MPASRCRSRRRVHEVVVPVNHPSQAGLQGGGFGVEVLTPEGISHLEAERVAGTQPARGRPGFDQPAVQALTGFDGYGDLGAALPGVTGPRHPARTAGELGRGDPEPLRGLTDHRLDQPARFRSLHSQQHGVVPDRSHLHVGRCHLGEARNDAVEVGAVGQHPERLVRQPPHDQVVEDPAAVVERHRVLGPSRPDRGDVVAQLVAEDFPPRALDENRPRWETSNTPTWRRTAMCSASTPSN